MVTLVSSQAPGQAAGQSVAIELEQWFQAGLRQARQGNRKILVSVAKRLYEPLDAISLFDRAATVTSDRFFWSQPDAAFTLVGSGIAQAFDAVEESRFRQIGASWRQTLSGAILEGPHGLPGVGPLLFGGFAFDTHQHHRSAPGGEQNGLWRGYETGRMVLPQVQVTWTGQECWITCNALVGPDCDTEGKAAELAAICDELISNAPELPNRRESAGEAASYEQLPAEEWKAAVRLTAADVAAGKLEKAVLARAIHLEAPQAFDAVSALRRLSETYAGCTIFAVARDERCFLGATPERLAKLHDGEFLTMSLAGTTRRGATPDEDDSLGNALLASPKNRREHAVVVQTLIETLQGMCAGLDYPEIPALIKLDRMQHLCTPITGRLKVEYTLLDVVERLHPTPAVGGRPREAALALIGAREGFDRGWYAGPIGWIDQHGEGEFRVAIRSALLNGPRATLFAGCGIVADSDAEREFAEASLKLQPMLSALTGK
jgi:isochorismate synthase